MREIQSDTNLVAATSGTVTSIRLRTAAVDVLQASRLIISEATRFMTYQLIFGRVMRLPIDFGTLLPEPPRDICKIAAKVAYNIELSYQIAGKIVGFGHRHAESRYNEEILEKQYKPGRLVHVVQHTHPNDVPSQLNTKFSELCKVLEVCGPTQTLRKLDTNKVLTASHNAARASTVTSRNFTASRTIR